MRLDLVDAGGDGGSGDHPRVAAPQRGRHLRGHAARLRNQLCLVQYHPPEPKLQQPRPACTARPGILVSLRSLLEHPMTTFLATTA